MGIDRVAQNKEGNWLYVRKHGSLEEDIVRYKARLVAKGYAQREGINYNEVFSHVVKHSSIRILLALVAQCELDFDQLDVKTAFLHCDLDEEIYMTLIETLPAHKNTEFQNLRIKSARY